MEPVDIGSERPEIDRAMDIARKERRKDKKRFS